MDRTCENTRRINEPSYSSSRSPGVHTSNVAKLPILEDQKLFSPGNLIQPLDRSLREIINDVGMCFEDAHTVSHLLRQAQKGRAGVHIGGDAEIRALDRDQVEEIAGERWSERQIGADGVGKGENGGLTGSHHVIERRVFRGLGGGGFKGLKE